MSFAMGMTLFLAVLSLFLVLYGLIGKSKAICLLGLCFLIVTALIFFAVFRGEDIRILFGGVAL